MHKDRCASAEEAFEQFSGVIQTLTEVYEDSTISATEHLREVSQLYGITFPVAPPQSPAEEERCIRKRLRCALVDSVLSYGPVANWTMRDDVAHVIQHKDGRITVFARSIPRLTKWEVKQLWRDIFTFLPNGANVRLVAIWKR